MNGRGLVGEYGAALRATSLADLRPLFDASVSAATIAAVMPAIARIAVHGSTYSPDPDGGGLAYILPVRVANFVTPEALDPAATIAAGDVVDLLAFRPDTPHLWATRRNGAVWLGSIEPRYLDPAPVPIWRSPLSWLRGSVRGLCVVARDQHATYRTLSLCHALIAEDQQHRLELERILSRPFRIPPITAPPEARRAA